MVYDMLTVNVCIGSSCHLKGSYEVLQTFQKKMEEEPAKGKIDLKAQFCMKQCEKGVSVSIGEETYSVSPETADAFFSETVIPMLDA